MKKLGSIILLSLSLVFVTTSPARADVEPFQAIKGIAENIVDKAKVITENAKVLYEKAMSGVKGVVGPIKSGVKWVKKASSEVKDAYNKGKDQYNQAHSAVDGTIDGAKGIKDDVNNLDTSNIDSAVDSYNKIGEALKIPGDLKPKNGEIPPEEIAKVYIPDYSKGNSTEIYKETAERSQAEQRDNIAELYSRAYVMRYNLRQEQEDIPEIDLTDERVIINATKDKALTIAKRLAKILELETMTYDYVLKEHLKSFQKTGSDETEEKQGEKQ